MSDKPTFKQIVENQLSDAEVRGLWFDWFCKDEALVRRGRSLIKKLQLLADSHRINENHYVFFKNNCPLNGRLYDSFSICDPVTQDVVFWVAPKLGYDSCFGEAEAVQMKPTEQKVNGTWADVKKFFKSTDEEWAAHLATLPNPKFAVGVKVAVLGGYSNETTEDEITSISDDGRLFKVKSLEHVTFKMNGEQVHSYGRHRRGSYPRLRRIEVWQDYHDRQVADETERKTRETRRQRLEAIRNHLYSVQYAKDALDKTELDAKLAKIEALLGINS